jgi:hypothetical protein
MALGRRKAMARSGRQPMAIILTRPRTDGRRPALALGKDFPKSVPDLSSGLLSNIIRSHIRWPSWGSPWDLLENGC